MHFGLIPMYCVGVSWADPRNSAGDEDGDRDGNAYLRMLKQSSVDAY